MPKKKTLSKYKKDLWDVFALYIKQKHQISDGYCQCYTCGSFIKIGTSNCQAGHYYSKKGYPALYFDENNVRPQCFHCNISLAGNTQKFQEKLINEIGIEGVEYLDKHRHDEIKRTKSDYIELINHYKNLIK